MPTTLSAGEEAQLAQTIEMFEVITQSQPQDYQSLEILKEAYSKLGRDNDVVSTSKRIAEAYVQMGQLSSAILEYETILQRFPHETEVQEALKHIENKAHSFPGQYGGDTVVVSKKSGDTARLGRRAAAPVSLVVIDDGRKAMFKLFVESKTISAGDFDPCWPKPDLVTPPEQIERTSFDLLPTLNINTEFWPTKSGECGVGPLDATVVLNSFKNDSFCKCSLEEDLQLINYQSHPAIKAPLSN